MLHFNKKVKKNQQYMQYLLLLFYANTWYNIQKNAVYAKIIECFRCIIQPNIAKYPNKQDLITIKF